MWHDFTRISAQRHITLQILAGNFLEIKPRSWESLVMLESYSVLADLERKYPDRETTRLNYTLYTFHSFETLEVKWQFIDSCSH